MIVSSYLLLDNTFKQLSDDRLKWGTLGPLSYVLQNIAGQEKNMGMQ